MKLRLHESVGGNANGDFNINKYRENRKDTIQLISYTVDVTKFNEESQDWSGDSFSTDGSDLSTKVIEFDFGKMNVWEWLKGLNGGYGFFSDKKQSDFCIMDDSFGINVIEDENGYEDEDGKYLAYYRFELCVNGIQVEFNDLLKLFPYMDC